MRTFHPVNDYVCLLFRQPLFKKKYLDGLAGQRFLWSPGQRSESRYIMAETDTPRIVSFGRKPSGLYTDAVELV